MSQANYQQAQRPASIILHIKKLQDRIDEVKSFAHEDRKKVDEAVQKLDTLQGALSKLQNGEKTSKVSKKQVDDLSKKLDNINELVNGALSRIGGLEEKTQDLDSGSIGIVVQAAMEQYVQRVDALDERLQKLVGDGVGSRRKQEEQLKKDFTGVRNGTKKDIEQLAASMKQHVHTVDGKLAQQEKSLQQIRQNFERDMAKALQQQEQDLLGKLQNRPVNTGTREAKAGRSAVVTTTPQKRRKNSTSNLTHQHRQDGWRKSDLVSEQPIEDQDANTSPLSSPPGTSTTVDSNAEPPQNQTFGQPSRKESRSSTSNLQNYGPNHQQPRSTTSVRENTTHLKAVGQRHVSNKLPSHHASTSTTGNADNNVPNADPPKGIVQVKPTVPSRSNLKAKTSKEAEGKASSSREGAPFKQSTTFAAFQEPDVVVEAKSVKPPSSSTLSRKADTTSWVQLQERFSNPDSPYDAEALLSTPPYTADVNKAAKSPLSFQAPDAHPSKSVTTPPIPASTEPHHPQGAQTNTPSEPINPPRPPRRTAKPTPARPTAHPTRMSQRQKDIQSRKAAEQSQEAQPPQKRGPSSPARLYKECVLEANGLDAVVLSKGRKRKIGEGGGEGVLDGGLKVEGGGEEERKERKMPKASATVKKRKM